MAMPSRAPFVICIMRARPLPSPDPALAFAVRLARQQERFGVGELDLAGRDRARAELVLQPADANAVAAAVAPLAQHEERRDAAGAVGRALGLGEHDPCLTVGVRGEPLEPVQPPRVAVRRRRRLELGEVGTAGAFGQRLDRLAGPLAGRELGHHPLADVGRRELPDEVHDHVAAGAERARHADLGLVEQVAVRRVEHREVHAVAGGVVPDRGRREAVGEHVATGRRGTTAAARLR